MSGRKYDTDKLRFDLLSPEFIEAMAEVMTYGAEKYGANNWQKVGDSKTRYTAALHRHLNAWQQGEQLDKESGLFHLAQIAVNAMFLFWEEQNADTNVRRCDSGAAWRDVISGKVSPDGIEVNDVETVPKPGEGLRDHPSYSKHITVCCKCGSYLGIRTRNLVFCNNECEQKFFSANNAPQDG